MSTTNTASTPVARRAAPSPRNPGQAEAVPSADERREMRKRGTLTIADKVMEKVAGQVAAEVGATRGRSGGVLGIGAEADANARPKVDVDLSADSVDLDIALGIAYPGSIRDAAQNVRDQVTRRVEELTGVPVHRVDVDVTFLTTSSGAAAGRPKEVLR